MVPRAAKLPKKNNEFLNKKEKKKKRESEKRKKKKLPRDAVTYKTIVPAKLCAALNTIEY